MPRVWVRVGDSVPHENPYPSYRLRVGFDVHSNSAQNGINAFRSGFLCHLSLLPPRKQAFQSLFLSVSTFLCQQPPLPPIPLSPQHLKVAVLPTTRCSPPPNLPLEHEVWAWLLTTAFVAHHCHILQGQVDRGNRGGMGGEWVCLTHSPNKVCVSLKYHIYTN